MIQVGRTNLTIEQVWAVAFDHERVEIHPDAIPNIELAANFVRQKAESGRAVYGVTTGFGANRDTVIPKEKAEVLQERLIMSHACGMGRPLEREIVRAMMLLRVNALARGQSGIRLQTLELLNAMLNKDLHPVVPELGSVGASGDLCPLAHMCLPMIGFGEVEVEGQIVSAEEAFASVGLKTARLTYKEGLALLNGTQAQTAVGIYVMKHLRTLLDSADVVGAMSVEAVAGRLEAFDDRIHQARGRAGQIQSASNVRSLLEGSELAGIGPGTLEGKEEYIQDSYCLRCLPQVHGATRDVADYVTTILETEANAVTDNPLVFPDGESAILSGGNFHGQPVAMAMDYLKIAISELGSISERRSAKLTDKCFSEGLPAFLVDAPGLNSGMMIPQYVAAALVTENKTQGFPSSMDSIPTSANMEDHVSMGMHSAVHAARALSNVQKIVGIEYLIAGQALGLRTGFKLGVGTQKGLDALREVIPFMEIDRVLYPDLQSAEALIRKGVAAAVLHD